MALRSLSRFGVEIGESLAVVGRRGNAIARLKSVGVERRASSWTGHFGRSRAPPHGFGASGSSTQVFKLVETDLMSRELTRYESCDARSLGLHSVEDVLSELAVATAALRVSTRPGSIPSCTTQQADDTPTPPALQESLDSDSIMRQERVLSAWGHVPRLSNEDAEVSSDARENGVIAVGPDLDSEQEAGKMAIKRTYQPSTLKRKRMHGFLYRSKSRLGKKILRRRLEKGRWRLAV